MNERGLFLEVGNSGEEPLSTRMTLQEQSEVKALLAAGISPTAIAKKIGRDHKTVVSYAKEPGTVAEVADLREDLSDAFEGLARRMVDSITDSDIEKINAYQRAVAAGIATDKMRLLRGQATSNQSVFFHIVQESDRQDGN
jgi:hypothetical protein